MEYQQSDYQDMNPYAVAPAVGISMVDAQRHEGGNVAAANAEARAISEVKAQVLLAKQFPRNAGESMAKILQECQRPTLADAAVYVFPRGKEMVSGPSIRLAEVMARNWGNNTFGLEVLERRNSDYGVGSSVLRAYAWDLETNTYISRQFELRHWRSTKGGGYKLTDDRDIYELEANMGSRRMRACILQMIPGDVTAAAVAACRKTTSSGLSASMSDPKKRAELISGTLSFYDRRGVTLNDLEDYLSAKVNDWTADHMVRLKELKNSLEDGVSTLADYFPHLASGERDSVISKEQTRELMELAKKTGQQGKISDYLKTQGIAKFADIPAVRFDEMKAYITAILPAPTTEPAPAQAPVPDEKPAPAQAQKTADKPKAKPPQEVAQEKLPWQ